MRDEAFKPEPWVRVENPDAAAILANPDTLRFLTPFIGHECSVSEATRALEVSLNRLKYWLGYVLKLDLIRVSNTIGGLKRYRAVADAFFVPFEATTAETAEALFEQWNAPWQPVYYKNLVRVLAETAQDWGARVQSGEDGLLNVALANGPERNWDFFDADAPPVLDGWITDLHLEPEDAKALLREMLYVYQRYAAKGGRQRYIARVSFAPLLDWTSGRWSSAMATSGDGQPNDRPLGCIQPQKHRSGRSFLEIALRDAPSEAQKPLADSPWWGKIPVQRDASPRFGHAELVQTLHPLGRATRFPRGWRSLDSADPQR